jgi:hypothetical protein
MSGAARYRGRNRPGSQPPPDDSEDPQPERPSLEQVPELPEASAGGTQATPMEGESDETVQETSATRHARLKALILEKRQQEEILAMELELSGDNPAFRADIAGEAPIQGHKRAVSSTAETQPFRSTFHRPKTPPTFKGKDIAELDKFDIAFRAHFEAGGPYTAPDQIKLAATYLDGNPQKSWFRRPKPESPEMTWDDFILYLKGLIADPANALAYASLRLKEARQKKGQSIRDFVNYIEQLERDIPEQTKQERSAWSLLNSLHPEIRREVMRENKEITSRDQVIAAAQRQEELAEQQSKKEPRPEEKTKETSTSSRRFAGATRAPRTLTPSPKGRGGRMFKCYNCGKFGHKKEDCTAPPQSEKSENKEQAKKGSPNHNSLRDFGQEPFSGY